MKLEMTFKAAHAGLAAAIGMSAVAPIARAFSCRIADTCLSGTLRAAESKTQKSSPVPHCPPVLYEVSACKQPKISFL